MERRKGKRRWMERRKEEINRREGNDSWIEVKERGRWIGEKERGR
jgi:hypothetical protein